MPLPKKELSVQHFLFLFCCRCGCLPWGCWAGWLEHIQEVLLIHYLSLNIANCDRRPSPVYLSSPSEMETDDLGKCAMWFSYLNCRLIRDKRKLSARAHLFAVRALFLPQMACRDVAKIGQNFFKTWNNSMLHSLIGEYQHFCVEVHIKVKTLWPFLTAVTAETQTASDEV